MDNQETQSQSRTSEAYEQPRLAASLKALNISLPKSSSAEELRCKNEDHEDEPLSRASKMARLVRRDSGLVRDRVKRSSRYPAVIVGCELVDWFISSGNCKSRLEAVGIGQKLMDANVLHHVYLALPFQDGPEFYRFKDDEDPATLSCAIALRSCSKAGLLSVKGTLSWHQRFCVVNSDAHLFYVYESDSSLHPKHVVDLRSADATVDDCVEAGRSSSSSGSTAFSLTLSAPSSGGTHVYGTDSETNYTDWLQALVKAGARYKNEDKLLRMATSIFEFSVDDIAGQEVALEAYRGKVCLVVNVASMCGLTNDNYKQLVQLYERHKDGDFEILAFPCNQFGGQEPEPCPRIKQLITDRYHVNFPMFDKVQVNGKDAHPLFKFLRHELAGVLTNSIKWNFSKFLCDRRGIPVKRFGPTTTPLEIEKDILKLLSAPKEVPKAQ